MRLADVANRHSILQELKPAVMRFVGGEEPPDVIKTILYRGDFFGTPFARFAHAVMRGPSEWTVGERELIAAYVFDTINRVANTLDFTLPTPAQNRAAARMLLRFGYRV